MEQNTILKEEIIRISEIMGIKTNLINEQWWKGIARTVLGATDLSDFLSHATSKLGKSITKLDDITKPSQWFKVLKNTPGKFRALKDALLDSINGELTTKGIIHTPQSWIKKTNEEILQDLQKIGVTGDNALEYVKMFQSKHGVRAKKVSASTSSGTIKPPKPSTSGVVNITDDVATDLANVWAAKTEQEIAEQLALKLPQASKQEISKGVKLIRKYQATNFDEMTQDTYNKYFNETVQDLGGVVKERLRKEAGQVGLMTKWNTLPSSVKKMAIGAGILTALGLGAWGLTLKFGKWSLKRVGADTEEETGIDIPGVDPNKKDDKEQQQQPIKRGKFD